MTHAKTLAAVMGGALGASLAWMPIPAMATEDPPKALSAAEEGKQIAFNRKLGNCLACHQMDDGVSPGTIGPPLLYMKDRFPDKARLRAQLYDATQFNPHSAMPPFGKHGALTEDQIDKIVEYLYTL